MKTTTLLFLICTCLNAGATNIRITDVAVETMSDTAQGLPVSFTIAWDNAWNNAKNHDAAWVFLKYKPRDLQAAARHMYLKPAGHAVLKKSTTTLPDPFIEVSEDRIGVFLYPSSDYRGNVEWTMRLFFDVKTTAQPASMPGDWSLFALEMVYVPAGGFTLGDPDTTALRAAAFFRSGPGGRYDGLFPITSEEQTLEVGDQPGALNYRSEEPEYQGDRQGPVPPEFPKGVQAFYVQKYEITQGQYAAFLNNLSKQASYFRANFAGMHYYKERGSITCADAGYTAGSPDRPLNFVGWDDGCAFADWAGLRPMTELEFEKACRGSGKPIPHEFPWGTGSKERLARFVDLDDELKNAAGLDESMLSDANRDMFGASHWWVMDLAGSLWERVVSIGHPNGRAFKGTHGDGRPGYYGYATNEDWPHGDDERGGGYGYRGGGYYEHGKPAGDFNPHSPIGWRNYAAWAGGPRSIAYGFRCVRTAK